MRNDKLLPCPFCGEKADLQYRKGDFAGFYVACRTEDCCGCPSDDGFSFTTEQYAIEAWNQRSNPHPSDDIKTIREAFEQYMGAPDVVITKIAGEYVAESTNRDWKLWQAAYKQAHVASIFNYINGFEAGIDHVTNNQPNLEQSSNNETIRQPDDPETQKFIDEFNAINGEVKILGVKSTKKSEQSNDGLRKALENLIRTFGIFVKNPTDYISYNEALETLTQSQLSPLEKALNDFDAYCNKNPDLPKEVKCGPRNEPTEKQIEKVAINAMREEL